MAVPIPTSVGYEGTVNEAQWATLMANAGGRQYGVATPGSWKVTAGGSDREVRIAAGSGFGFGVFDTSTSSGSLTLPAPASGSRWHLIVVRRDWQANQSSFDSVAGPTGSAAIPARQTSPGTTDDQPIALVRVQAGQSQVTDIIDLRVWGGDGGYVAVHELVLQYMNRPGTTIRIGAKSWARVFNSLGQPYWNGHSIDVQNHLAGVRVDNVDIAPVGEVGGLIVKTGQVTDTGFVQNGNQYLTAVGFTTAFPNELLSVQITQLQIGGALAAPTVALDGAHKAGFRPVYPGSTSTPKRSFLWVAYGY